MASLREHVRIGRRVDGSDPASGSSGHLLTVGAWLVAIEIEQWSSNARDTLPHRDDRTLAGSVRSLWTIGSSRLEFCE